MTSEDDDQFETSGAAEALWHNEWQILKIGVPIYATVTLAVTLLAPAGFGVLIGNVAAILGFFGHGLVLRTGIVTPARRAMDSTPRQLMFRWVSRLAYVAAGIWGYATFPAPLINVLAVSGTFVGLTMIVGWYARWSCRRDMRDEPIHLLEKVVLVAVGLAVVVTLTVLIVSAAAAGFAISWLMTWW